VNMRSNPDSRVQLNVTSADDCGHDIGAQASAEAKPAAVDTSAAASTVARQAHDAPTRPIPTRLAELFHWPE